MRRVILTLLIVVGTFLSASTANAVPAWYICEVKGSGATDSEIIYVRLTHTAASPAFERKWFRMSAAARNQMLALALTAITSDFLVQVRTDIDEPGAPFIDRFYLLTD